MKKKLKYVLIFLVVLIIFGGSLFLFMSKNNSKLDNNSNTEVQENNINNDNVNSEEEIKDNNDEKQVENNNTSNQSNKKPVNSNNSNKNDSNNQSQPSSNQSSSSINASNNANSGNSNNNGSSGSNNTSNQPIVPNNSNNGSNNEKKDDNTSNNNINNSNNSNNNGGDVKPSVVVDENDVYRKKIESTYGISIKYGDEIGDYKPQRLTPTRLLDSNKIKTNLGYIETELKKYPTGFFRDFTGMPLTIFLVASVPNNAFSGFTDRQFMSDIKITVVDSYSFSYTLNHEIMHYIDAYLEIKMYPNEPYQDYIKLNPVGFSYGNAQDKYNYAYNGQIKGAYFLNSYSQLDVREDRAEIFKQMMTRVYRPAGMFDEGEVMRKKALVISEQIKTYFPSAKGSQYWDKIIG